MCLTHTLPLLATILALFQISLCVDCSCPPDQWCQWETGICCPQGTVTCATGTGCCPCSPGTVAMTDPAGYGAVCCAPNQTNLGGICCNPGTEWCGGSCCPGTCQETIENQGDFSCQPTAAGCKAAGGSGRLCPLTAEYCFHGGYCVGGCCTACAPGTIPMTDPAGSTLCCLPGQFNLGGICCNQGTEWCGAFCCPGNCQETLGSFACQPTAMGCVAASYSRGTGQPCTTTADCSVGSYCEAQCCVEYPGPKIITSPGRSPCPAGLDGPYEFPHLIIPIDASQPASAPGTSFFGQATATISSIFNFDIPAGDVGKTCTLVFLFPLQSQLTTSSYTFSGSGTLDFALLSGVATASTSFSNAPGVATDYGHTTVAPGNAYTITTFSCPAGSAISFEISAVGGTYLDYFQDYNPAPIGLYITKC